MAWKRLLVGPKILKAVTKSLGQRAEMLVLELSWRRGALSNSLAWVFGAQ